MTIELERPFEAPWQARAFALTVKLHDTGLFTVEEWTQTLGAAVAADPDRAYYEAWLEALQVIAINHGALSEIGVEDTTQAWLDAAAHTPHGKPIELGPHEH